MSGIESSHVKGVADIPLRDICIGQLFRDTARRLPENLALVVRHQGRRLNYRELRALVERAARAFLCLGVQRGDRIGIWANNCAEWVIAQFAAASVGAVLVTISPSSHALELSCILRHSGCSILILSAGFPEKKVNYLEEITLVFPGVSYKSGSELQSVPELRTLVFLGPGPTPKGMLAWSELLAMGDQVSPECLDLRMNALKPEDAISIQYTSGTTGSPKGATLTHFGVVNNACAVSRGLGLSSTDRVCVPVPFYHCFGMVLGNLACIAGGASIIVPCSYFDAEEVLRAISEEACTVIYGVPTMFITQLEHRNLASFDLGTLRTGIMSGAPCPPELVKQVIYQMHCPQLMIAYGLTEASPVVTLSSAEDSPDIRAMTVGKPLPHVEVKVLTRNASYPAPIESPGELWTRGYNVMNGYYREPEATKSVIDDAGWLRTGDIGSIDANGYVKIVGRATDMIIRGGENIFPLEVEAFLAGCPGVQSVQVVGIPDHKYGEQVLAWVKLQPGVSLKPADIRAFCEGKIAYFKIPEIIRIVEEFPMTTTGKVQKFRIRQLEIEELQLITELGLIPRNLLSSKSG